VVEVTTEPNNVQTCFSRRCYLSVTIVYQEQVNLECRLTTMPLTVAITSSHLWTPFCQLVPSRFSAFHDIQLLLLSEASVFNWELCTMFLYLQLSVMQSLK